jgi:hypothetical protein
MRALHCVQPDRLLRQERQQKNSQGAFPYDAKWGLCPVATMAENLTVCKLLVLQCAEE